MVYLSKDERRITIVNAAVRIALTEGLTAATVRAVAKSINIVPGQIHHHFKTAGELRAEAFKAAVERSSATIPLDDPASVESLVKLLVGTHDESDLLVSALFNDALSLARRDDEVREAVNEMMKLWLSAIECKIEEGQKSGQFSDQINAQQVSQKLVALSIGLDTLMGLNMDQEAWNNIEQTVHRIVVEELT